MSSVCKENTRYKHIKIADDEKKSVCTMSKKEESLLEKIKLVIGEQMDSLNNDFNQNLEGLTRRVEQVQCKKTHEEIAKSLLNKVSKLERHINDVIAFQDKAFSEKAVHQDGLELDGKLDFLKTFLNGKGTAFKQLGTEGVGFFLATGRLYCNNTGTVKHFSIETSRQFSHLPPLVRIPLCPEPAEEFTDPPQNPETKSGLCAKSWTRTERDLKCASLCSDHLYLFYENLSNNSASHWEKISKIKALPCSVPCCLSQVIIPKKYYFVIQ